MTEAEWLACEKAEAMLAFLTCDSSERKRRLFAVGCARRIEYLILRFRGAWRAVILAERIADGETVSDEAKRLRVGVLEKAFRWIDCYRPEKENNVMYHAGNAAADCLAGIRDFSDPYAFHGGTLFDTAESVARAATHWERRNDRDPLSEQRLRIERASLAPLIHCVFGNPFRPVTFSPAWQTDTAMSLARGMYDSRDFGAMPILADALQDAGCDSDDILNHCRDSKQVHVRGCWVVDLLLDKL